MAQLTSQGQISYANATLARLAGRELNSLLGIDFEQMVAQPQRAAWRQALQHAAGGATARVSLQLAPTGNRATTIA